MLWFVGKVLLAVLWFFEKVLLFIEKWFGFFGRIEDVVLPPLRALFWLFVLFWGAFGFIITVVTDDSLWALVITFVLFGAVLWSRYLVWKNS